MITIYSMAVTGGQALAYAGGTAFSHVDLGWHTYLRSEHFQRWHKLRFSPCIQRCPGISYIEVELRRLCGGPAAIISSKPTVRYSGTIADHS